MSYMGGFTGHTDDGKPGKNKGKRPQPAGRSGGGGSAVLFQPEGMVAYKKADTGFGVDLAVTRLGREPKGKGGGGSKGNGMPPQQSQYEQDQCHNQQQQQRRQQQAYSVSTDGGDDGAGYGTGYGAGSAPAPAGHPDPAASAGAPKEKGKGKGKGRAGYVSMYSAEGQGQLSQLMPGRQVCGCNCTKHPLVNNCVECGRIVCSQEGVGPCM